MSIVGFDFIKTSEGYKIVDENNFPGFYLECFKASKASPSDLIFKMIFDNCRLKNK
jgi:glutathione synthase/RimK-type ligase-like ATP-grasp enzyme